MLSLSLSLSPPRAIRDACYFYSFEMRRERGTRRLKRCLLRGDKKQKKTKKRVLDSHRTTRTLFFTETIIQFSIRRCGLPTKERARSTGAREEEIKRERKSALQFPRRFFSRTRERERERGRERARRKSHHHRSSRRNPHSRACKRLNKHHVWNIRVLELRGAENEEGNR